MFLSARPQWTECFCLRGLSELSVSLLAPSRRKWCFCPRGRELSVSMSPQGLRLGAGTADDAPFVGDHPARSGVSDHLLRALGRLAHRHAALRRERRDLLLRAPRAAASIV